MSSTLLSYFGKKKKSGGRGTKRSRDDDEPADGKTPEVVEVEPDNDTDAGADAVSGPRKLVKTNRKAKATTKNPKAARAGAGAGAGSESGSEDEDGGGAGAGAVVDAKTARLQKLIDNTPPDLVSSVDRSWLPVLAPLWLTPSYKRLSAFVTKARAAHAVYPPQNQVFTAFSLTALESVRVVVLGQDPYHGPGQANGMAFSVARGVKTPPSLRNILKEAADDVGISIPSHGDLTAWGKQGVLLLNNTLTVEKAKAGSHQKQGWEDFTKAVVDHLNRKCNHLVFLLWGKPAQTKAKGVDRTKHCVLTSPHPSPLSAHRGFFGCKHFSQTNAYLTKHGLDPIDWAL